MRRLSIICCAILAGCGQQSGNQGAAQNASANAQRNTATATPALIGTAAMTEQEISQLFDLPESRRRTECDVADYFPDRNVPPGFYNELSEPQFNQYLSCLLREARRDGGRARLAGPGSFPRVGSYLPTRIASIGSRFAEGMPSSDAGTTVDFDNGVHLVDYGLIEPVARSRAGDAVRLCVHALPEDCPGHDIRGIEYRAHNLRSGETWTMVNSQHMCRGA
jgi:hypothetical protein